MFWQMRHAFLTLAVGLALPAIFVPAAGAKDPQAPACKGLDPGVRNIKLNVKPATAGSVSAFTGGVLLCGSDLGPKNPKGFKSGSIKMPWARKGALNKKSSDPEYVQLIQTRCANPKFYNVKGGSGKATCPAGSGPYSLKEGQYTGSVGMGISTGDGLLALDGALSRIYVQKAPGTPKGGNTHCTKDAVACLQGTDGALGYADMTIDKTPKTAKTATDTYTLNIFPIKLLFGLKLDVYYTRIGYPKFNKPLDLCAYAGAVNGKSCGSPSSGDWVQKNGPAAQAGCSALDWALGGWQRLGYTGPGFIITTDNNVPKANDWWGPRVSTTPMLPHSKSTSFPTALHCN